MKKLLLVISLIVCCTPPPPEIVIKDKDAFFAGSVEEGQAILDQYNWKLVKLDSAVIKGKTSLRTGPRYVYIFYYSEKMYSR
jgi:hypothetical protein